MSTRPVICFVCTGNAARSVMAVAMLRSMTDAFDVRGGGTHSIEGRPMSVRTRSALARHDLADLQHRSHQLTGTDVEAAALVVAMEPDHVEWVRRHHPHGAKTTATLRRLVRDMVPSDGGEPGLGARVAALALDEVVVEEWETVVDPGAGEQADFDRCSDELMVLVTSLRSALG